MPSPVKNIHSRNQNWEIRREFFMQPETEDSYAKELMYWYIQKLVWLIKICLEEIYA
jgi:hypothetical protein